ncbi:hypothetical protein EON64_08695 [archaeon]|nr:MAG: hypothetical protein EON64_08695 [archaeon]
MLTRLLDSSANPADTDVALTRRIFSQQDGHEALLAKERRGNAQLRDLLLSVKQSLVEMHGGPKDSSDVDSLGVLLKRIDEGLSGCASDSSLPAAASPSSLVKSCSNQVLNQEDSAPTPGGTDKLSQDAAGILQSDLQSEDSPYETGGPVGYDTVDTMGTGTLSAKEYPDSSSGKYANSNSSAAGNGETSYVMCDEPDQLPSFLV